MKKIPFVITLTAVFCGFALGQNLTARASAKGASRAGSQISLSAPHACSVSKRHPCVYYAGDLDANNPNGFSNENTLLISDSWTYNEIKSPIAARVSAAFTNNLQTFDLIDPRTANWDFRVGVTNNGCGTSVGSGTNPALLTPTGRSAFGYTEYELLTTSPLSVPKGNVWFDVQPNCTNPSDGECSSGRYFLSDTNGLNSINGQFTQTSENGIGPISRIGGTCSTLNSSDGMSAGLLK